MTGEPHPRGLTVLDRRRWIPPNKKTDVTAGECAEVWAKLTGPTYAKLTAALTEAGKVPPSMRTLIRWRNKGWRESTTAIGLIDTVVRTESGERLSLNELNKVVSRDIEQSGLSRNVELGLEEAVATVRQLGLLIKSRLRAATSMTGRPGARQRRMPEVQEIESYLTLGRLCIGVYGEAVAVQKAHTEVTMKLVPDAATGAPAPPMTADQHAFAEEIKAWKRGGDHAGS